MQTGMRKAADSDSDSEKDESRSGDMGATNVPHQQEAWRAYSTVGILAMINLLNFMDRYTIAGVLPQVIETYGLTQAEAGLPQTVFICSYMIFAPLFGFLGDRYDRKWLMVVGITIWSGVTFGSSFVPDDQYWLFVFTRALVGIGESCYMAMGPPIVSDLFAGDRRVSMLTILYLAAPIGSGLGFLVGAQLAAAFGDWRYALRLTPLIAAVCVILLILFVRDPERGYADRLNQGVQLPPQPSRTSDSQSDATSAGNTERTDLKAALGHWWRDVYSILRIPTFQLATGGNTAMIFVTGALSWWCPTYFFFAFQLTSAHIVFSRNLEDVSFIIGLLICVAGVLSVSLGLVAARALRPSIGMRADTYICAAGMFFGGPMVYLMLIFAPFNDLAAYLLGFLAQMGLCIVSALTAEITMRIVLPSRRSSANALSMLFVHLFGDALCPLLLGAIADALVWQLGGDPTSDCSQNDCRVRVIGLMYSLFINAFVSILGAGMYLFCSFTLEKDAKRNSDLLAGISKQTGLAEMPSSTYNKQSSETNQYSYQTSF